MLANANVKILEDEEDEDKHQQTDIDLEANRKKRVKKHDKTDTLTSEQMSQVHSPVLKLMCECWRATHRNVSPCSAQAVCARGLDWHAACLLLRKLCCSS